MDGLFLVNMAKTHDGVLSGIPTGFGSKGIGLLPGLTISLLLETLQRSRKENHSLVGAWLLSQFQ